MIHIVMQVWIGAPAFGSEMVMSSIGGLEVTSCIGENVGK